MSLKTCPWCEGKGVVGRLAFGDATQRIRVLGRDIPVAGTFIDQPCGVCGGAKTVSPERHAELTRRPESV